MSLLARSLSIFLVFAEFVSLPLADHGSVWAGAAADEFTAKIDAAKKEGKVILYTNASGIAPLIKRFEEKYPFIKVEQLRTGAPKLLSRVLAESKAGALKADLIETEGLTSYLMMKRGLYAKYVSPESKALPAGAKDADGQWTNAHSNYKIVAYNPRFVTPAELPKSYEDLTQPKWNGKILMGSNNYEWFGNMVKILGEEKGMNLMRRLNGQNLMLREGNSLILQLLLAGEGFVSIAANVDSVEELKAKGVQFLSEPAQRPYGIEAVFKDNSGNWFSLTEPGDGN